MTEIAAVECPWCKAIRAGDARFPVRLEMEWCGEHKALWLSAATGALALARMHITRGKWGTHWKQIQVAVIRVAGCVPMHLPDGTVGVARVVAERTIPE